MGTTSQSGGQKTALISGATSGLGFEATRQLVLRGFHVIMTGRDATRGEAALQRLKTAHPEANLTFLKLDIASLDEIRRFNAALAAQPLNLLLNNAGVMAPPQRASTHEGHELQFGTNHLGHFLLTAALLPRLIEGRGMIVTVASLAARKGKIHFDDLDAIRHYDPFDRYRQSKLANLMFALRLEKHLKANQIQVRSRAAHPGWTRTSIIDNVARHDAHLTPFALFKRRLFTPTAKFAFSLAAQDVRDGVKPLLAPLDAPETSEQLYFGPQGVGERRGAAGAAWIPRQAMDTEEQEQLWRVSVAATDATFPFAV